MEQPKNIVAEYHLLKKWISVIFKFQGQPKNDIICEKWDKLIAIYKKNRQFDVNHINGKIQLVFDVEGQKCQILVSFVRNPQGVEVFSLNTDERSKRVVYEFKEKAAKAEQIAKQPLSPPSEKEQPLAPSEVQETKEKPAPPVDALKDQVFEEIIMFTKQFIETSSSTKR